MPRHLVRVIIFSLPCAVFCASAPAHAQAVDSFNPGTNGVVIALATQPDGKLLVGGSFGQLGGAPRNDLGRFNSDGSLDATFNPGVSGEVFTLVVQPDGKILVGGSFTMLGGGGQGTVPRQNIGRLNADGSIDPTFDPGTDGLVEALALQPDGKILVGGSSRGSAAERPALCRAAISGGSIPMARSTQVSIRARIWLCSRSPCSPMTRF